MNARKSTLIKISIGLTSLAICAALTVFETSCANTDSTTPSTGGNKATGGTQGGTGGVTGAGGSGSSSTGGSATVGSGNTVTFSSGQAQGAMTGYGWIAMGTMGDTATDPTCSGTTISATAACNDPTGVKTTTWNSTSALCITGNIEALPATPTQTDYSSNWGLEVGVNAGSDATQTLGKTFSSINVAVSGSPTSSLRVDIGIKGGDDNKPYCASWTQGAINLTTFNTECWGPTATAVYLTATDVPNITKVMIQVPSSAMATPVTNLCMTGITFN